MLFLLLLALCLLTYLPALYATPIWDDIQLFHDPDMPKWKFAKWNMLWHPRFLTKATFGLTFRAFQKVREEWRHTMIVSTLHLTNILLHWINACLVYWVASFVVADRATVASLLFAVHPLAASTVAPIISRSSLMSSSFIFLAIGATLSGHSFLALPLAVGAYLCKEDGIAVVPLIIALTALQSPKEALLVVGLCMLGFQRLAKKLIALSRTLAANNGDVAMVNAGLAASLPQPQYSATAIVENLRRWPLWMLGFELNPDPDPKARTIQWGAVGLLVLILLFEVAAFFNIEAFLFVIVLSPWAASWFFRLPDPVSEVRAYSTVLGGCLLLSYMPIPLVVPFVVWFAAIASFRAWMQQNEMALWRHAWNEGSKKLKVAINLAAAYQRCQKLQEAFDWHKKALEIAPENGLIKMNLALWFEGQARLQRQMVTNVFVAEGKADQKTFDEGVQKAHQFMAQAVILAREGIKGCPNDPWVKHYYQKIEEHATRIGLQVQAVPATKLDEALAKA